MDNNNENNNTASRAEKTKNRLDRLSLFLTVYFCAVTAAVMLLVFILPDRAMSEKENRVLAGKPHFSASSVFSGRFMQDFESYISDQFPLRDSLISVKTYFDRVIGKKEENGVYIGKSGFLFEKQAEFDKKKMQRLTKEISAFAAKNKSLKKAFILSPNSTCVLSRYLPNGLSLPSQEQQLKELKASLRGVPWIDCLEAFDGVFDKTSLFYRTDHHWTTLAANSAFKQLSKKWKLDRQNVQFDFFDVSSSFRGTLASTSGVSDTEDKIQVCVPKNSAGSYVVSYESSGRKTASLFEKDKLETVNQYEVFLGGNYDKAIISTDADNDDALLLFKDSYANCMIPMLTPYFSKIVVIDPRYFSDSLSEIMKEYEFTHILFVYNLNTFLADTSLADTLKS